MTARARFSRRRLVPARGLWIVLAPFAVLSLLPVWFPAATTLWYAYGLLAFVVAAADASSRPQRGSLRLKRALPDDVRVGRKSSYVLQLESRVSRVLRLRYREVLPAPFDPVEVEGATTVAPGRPREIEIEFVPRERGPFSIAPLTIRVATPLSLFRVEESLGDDDELVVLPGRPRAETDILLARAALLEEAGARVVRRRGHDSDFESLRDYVVGDDLRFVDWKATARRGQPQVRQFQLERNAEIILALDCGRLMGNLVRGVSKLDLAIVSVLDLAAVAARRKERVGLLAFDSQVLSYASPGSGLRQIGQITDCLGRLQTSFRQTSYTRAVEHLQAHHKRRALVVLFTDFTDDISSRELQHVLAALSRRHVMLFVAVGDRHLEDVIAEIPRTTAAVYQKAAAADLLSERRRVIEGLTRLGVLTVDADPFSLSAPLIRSYLEARGRM